MIQYLENAVKLSHTHTQLPWWTHTPWEVADTCPHLTWVNYTTNDHSQVITNTENYPGCWRRWIYTPWDVADTHPHLENVVDHNAEWSQSSYHLHTVTLVNLHTLGHCWHSSTPGKCGYASLVTSYDASPYSNTHWKAEECWKKWPHQHSASLTGRSCSLCCTRSGTTPWCWGSGHSHRRWACWSTRQCLHQEQHHTHEITSQTIS